MDAIKGAKSLAVVDRALAAGRRLRPGGNRD